MRSPPLILLAALALSGGCTARRGEAGAVPGASHGAAARGPDAVLARFLSALDAGRWTEACGLLSARWRAAYTPRRLELDRQGAGPVAQESAARVAAALAAGARLRVEDGRASLPVAPGRAVVLVAEPGGWRVDALE